MGATTAKCATETPLPPCKLCGAQPPGKDRARECLHEIGATQCPNRAANCPASFGVYSFDQWRALHTALPTMDLATAEPLAKQTEYAFDAVQPADNRINWGDASAFFLEGYEYARKQLKQHPHPQPAQGEQR